MGPPRENVQKPPSPNPSPRTSSCASIQQETTDTALGARRWFPSSSQQIRCFVMMLSACCAKILGAADLAAAATRATAASTKQAAASGAIIVITEPAFVKKVQGLTAALSRLAMSAPPRRVRPGRARPSGGAAACGASAAASTPPRAQPLNVADLRPRLLDARLPARSRSTELPAARQSLGA